MKLLLSLALLCSLSATAAQTNNPATHPPPPPPIAGEPAKHVWTYSKGEFSADSYYTARFSGSFDEPVQGVGFGVGYAITRNLVAQVHAVSYNLDVQTINEVSGRLAFRAPLSFLSPKLAPYAFVEGGGGLQNGIGFGAAGGGIEWRPVSKYVSLFTEADLRLDTEWQSSVGVNGGLRLRF